MTAWKLLTADFRPPVQGGEPVWDGTTLPFQLPTVELDTSDEQCSYGWNYVTDLAEGFKIAYLWPTGRPSAVLVVTPGDDAIERGNKHRASTLRLERFATTDEIRAGLLKLSAPFGSHAERMADEQLAWWHALARPAHDPEAVADGLRAALRARGLDDWSLRDYGTPGAAWAARDAWDAWDAWDVRDAWAAWAARDAWDARDAWAAWAARDAWDAWDARAALTFCYAALQGWITHDPLLLTTGIRDAYANGLELAVPTGPKTLGYALTAAPVEAVA